ncbi:hypothetical protein EDM56_22000 [Brevibacillus fluminis]|uniref:Uncharacterized protein n=1 Tax=Brevibacillus fluminis TaxID=511487 RepID=A0A3M8D5I4_9BACL|nr:hypothetical protein [Brevibacillus fluminis]RNB83344.1 hypothetical protein EDM56_22000 [Brevibacillus fluminis]
MKNDGLKASEMLRWFAWIAIGIGSLLLIGSVSDFSSSNLPLMVSIGFLIAGVNIFVLSTAFRLLIIRTEEN